MLQHGQLTRRQFTGGLAAALASAGLTTMPRSTEVPADLAYRAGFLPPGIRSRFVTDVNALTMHVLEAGLDGQDRPCVLLLHGFPELAYSWRKVMLPLAAAGFHVIAPDQRGYGRTTGWDGDYDGDLGSFRFLNLVRDALGLVSAFGYARSLPSSGTISALPWQHGVPSCGPMCFAPWC